MKSEFPDFFVLGAVKCGTTSMYRYLAQHPDLFLPRAKEPQYFCWDLGYPRAPLSREAYLALYAESGDRLRGDCSPQYFHVPEAPQRIRDAVPHAKAVVMLRNPVSFLHSWFHQTRYAADETADSILEGLALEPLRAEGRWLPPGGSYRAPPFYLRYRRFVDFPGHLARVFEAFPREQVQVVVLEEFLADRERAFAEILGFLGVDDRFRPDFAVHNASKRWRNRTVGRMLRTQSPVARRLAHLVPERPRQWALAKLRGWFTVRQGKPPLTEAERVELERLTAPVVAGTEALLGRPIPSWHRPARATGCRT
ncbi:MAG: sulfotransferase domain-containing protein [Myxococcota bacterium]